jgi:hypothetical protein
MDTDATGELPMLGVLWKEGRSVHVELPIAVD